MLTLFLHLAPASGQAGQSLLPSECKVPALPAARQALRAQVYEACKRRGEPFGYVLCVRGDDGALLETTDRALRRRPDEPQSSSNAAVYKGMPLCEGDRIVTWQHVTVQIQEVSRSEAASAEVGQTWTVESFTDLRLSWSQSVLSEGRVSLYADPLFKDRRIVLGDRGVGWGEKPPVTGTSHSNVTLEVLDRCRGEAVVSVYADSVAPPLRAQEHYMDVLRPHRWLPWRSWERVHGGESKHLASGGQQVDILRGEVEAAARARTTQAANDLDELRDVIAGSPAEAKPYFAPPLPGQTEWEIRPPNATVWLDDREVKLRAGRLRASLPPGIHRLEASAPGYKQQSVEFEVKEGQTAASVKLLRQELLGNVHSEPRSSLESLAPSRAPDTAAGGASGMISALPGSGETIAWVTVPGGAFMMGDNDQGRFVHPVSLPTFQMSKTEVTVAQFRACVTAGRCTEPNSNRSDPHCNWGVPNRDQFPVNCVSADQASAFASWAGGQLPTESQWEYAATGGGKTKYSGTNELTRICQFGNVADETAASVFSKWMVVECADGYVETAPVGQFKDGAWGLKDLTGNVWEWVQDCYDSSSAGIPGDGSARVNCDSSAQVFRGGGWFYFGEGLRAVKRFWMDPGAHSAYIGIRLVRVPPAATEAP